MADDGQDDPYVPTPDEVAAVRRAKDEQAATGIVAKVIRIMSAEIGRVKRVLAPGTAVPMPTKSIDSARKDATNQGSAPVTNPLVAEQEGLGFTAQQQSLTQGEPPKVKRSINISHDVVRRRGQDVERPK